MNGPQPQTRPTADAFLAQARADLEAAYAVAAKLEDPWETTAGGIQWPDRDLPVAKYLGNPRSNLKTRVTKFADHFAWRFDQLFP